MSKNLEKRFPVGTRLKVVLEYGHTFNYTGVVVASDKESVTITLDHDKDKLIRCVPSPLDTSLFDADNGDNYYIYKEKAKDGVITTSQLIDAVAILMNFPEDEKHYLGSSVGMDLRLRYAQGYAESLKKEGPNKGFSLRVRLLDIIEEAGQHEDDIDVSDMLKNNDKKLILALLKINEEDV